jgi:Zn-dependent alcohol dehydrogenase
MRLITSRKIPLRRLITGRAKLEDIVKVFEDLKQGKEIKVAITYG